MYRGTTPTYTLTLPETVDLTEATEVIVTFATTNHEILLEKHLADVEIELNTISVWISQEESLLFPIGLIEIQVNWTYVSGEHTDRACTEIVSVTSHRNLHDEVI